MFSLKDELSKFLQQTLVSPELQNYIPLDSQFLDKHITVEYLLRENGFILSQMKNFGALFHNYCVLNNKVYSKITEAELIMTDKCTKVSQIAITSQRKIDQAIKDVKKMHQQANSEYLKAKNIINTVKTDLQHQMTLKATQTDLQALRNQLQIQFGVNSPDQSLPDSVTSSTPKFVAYVDFCSQMEKIMQQIHDFKKICLEKTNKIGEQHSVLLDKQDLKIRQAMDYCYQHESQIGFMKQKHQKLQYQLTEVAKNCQNKWKLIQQQYLTKKQYITQIHGFFLPKIDCLENVLSKNHIQILQNQTILKQNIFQMKSHISSIKDQFTKQTEQFKLDSMQLNQKYKKLSEFQQSNHTILSANLRNLSNSFQKTITKLTQQSEKHFQNINSLKTSLNSAKTEIQKTIMADLQRDLLKRLKNLTEQFMSVKVIVGNAETQRKSLKETISNFASLIGRKVSEQDLERRFNEFRLVSHEQLPKSYLTIERPEAIQIEGANDQNSQKQFRNIKKNSNIATSSKLKSNMASFECGQIKYDRKHRNSFETTKITRAEQSSQHKKKTTFSRPLTGMAATGTKTNVFQIGQCYSYFEGGRWTSPTGQFNNCWKLDEDRPFQSENRYQFCENRNSRAIKIKNPTKPQYSLLSNQQRGGHHSFRDNLAPEACKIQNIKNKIDLKSNNKKFYDTLKDDKNLSNEKNNATRTNNIDITSQCKSVLSPRSKVFSVDSTVNQTIQIIKHRKIHQVQNQSSQKCKTIININKIDLFHPSL